MKLKDKIMLSGYVEVRTYDARYIKTYKDMLIAQNRGLLDKVTIEKTSGKNLVVNSGINQLIALLVGSSTKAFTWCGVGTGTSAVTPSDIDLQTPLLRVAVATGYGYNNTATFVTFFTQSQAAGTWAESGLFTDSSSGSMFAHKLFSSTLVKDSTKTASVIWVITPVAV